MSPDELVDVGFDDAVELFVVVVVVVVVVSSSKQLSVSHTVQGLLHLSSLHMHVVTFPPCFIKKYSLPMQ